VRQAIEKPVDFLRKALAARIEGWSIERGVAVDAAPRVPVALKDSAERSRHRDAPLGVDLVRVCRDKAIHPSWTRTSPTYAGQTSCPRPVSQRHRAGLQAHCE